MKTGDQPRGMPFLRRAFNLRSAKAGGFVVGLAGVIVAIVAIAQLRHDIAAARSQNLALTTRLAILEKQCALQGKVATLQTARATAGPAATAVAERQVQLESTIQALERERLGIGPPRPRDAQVDRLFAQWDKPGSPGCALGVIQDGEFIYKRGYGMANLELDVPITPSTVFRIGSTSKQFTAAAIHLLAEEGKLTLDDDLRTYFPQFPDWGTSVTVRHLLHHTSGIPDYFVLAYAAGYQEDDYFTADDVVAMLANQEELDFVPGEAFRYSNSGYFLLSQIVQRASGKSLRKYAEAKIFRPLGMTNTHFHDDHNEIVPNRASGYALQHGRLEISMTTLDMVGDGGVFTTVEDLFHWDQNFYHQRIGGDSFWDQMLTRGVLSSGDTLSYASGLVHGTYRGLETISHGGGFAGFRAEMMRFPQSKFTVICLCNLSAIEPTELAKRVADIYLFGK